MKLYKVTEKRVYYVEADNEEEAKIFYVEQDEHVGIGFSEIVDVEEVEE